MSEKNTIVRVSLSPIEMESVNYLLVKLGRPKPHDLIRVLIANKFTEEKSNDLRYGRGGPRSPRVGDEDVPRETVEQRVAALMAKEEIDIIQDLAVMGFIEDLPIQHFFAAGDPDIEQQKGKRYLVRRQWINAESKDEAQIYEKDTELPAAVIAYLKAKQ